jgi:sulfite exporter TauE/SafE
MQGLLLGLANGTTCLAYCAPVLIPLFLGEGRRVRQNWSLLAQFLGGRLIGYLLFGLLAWTANQLLFKDAALREVLFGGIYVLLAGLLLIYGLNKVKGSGKQLQAEHPAPGSQPTFVGCPIPLKKLRPLLMHWPVLVPAMLGLLTGLNLCPPFLLAFANAVISPTLLDSLLFFITFFVGTAIFFLPVAFVGLIRNQVALQTVGKLTALIMAGYYLFSGIVQIYGGIQQL